VTGKQEERTVHFGGFMFFTDYSMTPGALARALEERGFESVWAPEHSHIPLSRRSPWPGGGELPKQYYDVMDPFVTLTAAALATKTLRIGTGVCLVVQRDPIQTAKLVASVDQVSDGRFLFGIGVGWNAEEMADHGTTDFGGRHKLARERIEAMKAIWTRDQAEYHGDLVQFGTMMAWPKPVQKPHPPVIVGGAFPQAARRAVRYGDGWIPLAGRGGDVAAQIPRFRDMLTEAGRAQDSCPITIFGAPEDVDVLKRYADLGVVRVTIALPAAKEDQVLPILDRWMRLMRATNGESK
jgi:probable F420-dependent oxidoreductase